jgi:large subunit ribosomal protein L29
MKVREIRELAGEDLKTRIDDTRKNIVELRFSLAMRKLESPAKLRAARKHLAQLLTIQHEAVKGKEAQGTPEAKTEKVAKKSAQAPAAKAKAPKAKVTKAKVTKASKPAKAAKEKQTKEKES